MSRRMPPQTTISGSSWEPWGSKLKYTKFNTNINFVRKYLKTNNSDFWILPAFGSSIGLLACLIFISNILKHFYQTLSHRRKYIISHFLLWNGSGEAHEILLYFDGILLSKLSQLLGTFASKSQPQLHWVAPAWLFSKFSSVSFLKKIS